MAYIVVVECCWGGGRECVGEKGKAGEWRRDSPSPCRARVLPPRPSHHVSVSFTVWLTVGVQSLNFPLLSRGPAKKMQPLARPPPALSPLASYPPLVAAAGLLISHRPTDDASFSATASAQIPPVPPTIPHQPPP